MSTDEKLVEAWREYRSQMQSGILPDLQHLRSFSTKPGTQVTHYKWTASNGYTGLLVQTLHGKAQPGYELLYLNAPGK